MGTNACPHCGKPIPADDINIHEGAGLCRACGKLSRLAEIVDQPDFDPKMLTNPPAGCWYDERFGQTVVYASQRSVGSAIGTLAICLFWNGIVSVFVLIALAGLYTRLVGPLPEWFPAPDFDKGDGMPLGMTLFLCVFLLPFVTIGLIMFLTFLACLMGRVEVTASMGTGRVRTGFGPFNWTRRFDASSVKRVSLGETSYQQNGQAKPVIQIEAADRKVKFGSMLPDERRAWMLGALHLLLVVQAKSKRPMRGMSMSSSSRG